MLQSLIWFCWTLQLTTVIPWKSNISMKNWSDIHMSYFFQAYFKYISNMYQITLPETLVTVRTWKKKVGRRSFPFGMAYFGRCVSLVSGRVFLFGLYVKQIYVKHINSHITVVIITNPNNALTGNPSNLPYICIICIAKHAPPNRKFDDPCINSQL